jgi:hypothetical protein
VRKVKKEENKKSTVGLNSCLPWLFPTPTSTNQMRRTHKEQHSLLFALLAPVIFTSQYLNVIVRKKIMGSTIFRRFSMNG